MTALAKIFTLALVLSSTHAFAATVLIKKVNTTNVVAHQVSSASMRLGAIDLNVKNVNGAACVISADFVKSLGIDGLSLMKDLNSASFDYVIECVNEYDKTQAVRLRPRLTR